MTIEEEIDAKLGSILSKLEKIEGDVLASGKLKPPRAPVPEPIDEGALYERFKARLLAEAPGLLRLLVDQPELHVTIRRPVIEVDSTSLRGRIGQLIVEGVFDTPVRPSMVVRKLESIGYPTSAKDVSRALGKLLELHVLVKDQNGLYQTTPGLKVERKEG